MDGPLTIGLPSFLQLLGIMQKFPCQEIESLQARLAGVDAEEAGLREELRGLDQACAVLLREARQTSLRRDALTALDPTARDDLQALREVAHDAGFVVLVTSLFRGLYRTFRALRELRTADVPGALLLPAELTFDDPASVQAMLEEPLQLQAVVQMNQPAVQAFVAWVIAVERGPNEVVRALEEALLMIENYHGQLTRRHTVEGYRIHGDPVLTDVAVSIFEHVDRHGEIRDGAEVDAVSAYARHQGVLLARAVKTGALARILGHAPELFANLRKTFLALWEAFDALRAATKEVRAGVARALRAPAPEVVSSLVFERALRELDVLDLHRIRYRPNDATLTREERVARDFRDQTLEGLVERLRDPAVSPEATVQYVLGRKKEDRVRVEESTTFYLCRIGGGNPFLRESPGALEVYPGTPPQVDLDRIRGGGFDTVRRFVATWAELAKYRAFFEVTHPAANAPKGNLLLIGPPGCGKTEFLRGLATQPDTIVVYASGSDLQTCWLGEASKNPKRLFEQAAALARKADKDVVIVIDEIDQPLGERDEALFARSGVNLVPEFLQLLDGLVDYPRVRLCGATNHPEKLSTRVLRRFQLAVVVGELDRDDRVALLRDFFRHLPTAISDADWQGAAVTLDGAVGDVLRKVAEGVWRDLVTGFVRTKPVVARTLTDSLQEKGVTFQAHDLSDTKRGLFKAALANHLTLDAATLHAAVANARRDPALRQEIEEAQVAYRRHRAFLAALDAPEMSAETR